MSYFVLLTRLSPELVASGESILELNAKAKHLIGLECPEVRWVGSYAVSGPYDYLDIFEAPNNHEATKVSVIIRSIGHGVTELWMATPWDQFTKLAEAARLVKSKGS